jgi:hypothetical protein
MEINLRIDRAKSTTPPRSKKMMNTVDITHNIATNSIKKLKIINQPTDQDSHPNYNYPNRINYRSRFLKVVERK